MSSSFGVTVILTGIPQHDPRFSLQDLAYFLDKAFDTEEIGTFRLREVWNKIAIDFNSGYDAMLAQSLLDGKSFKLDDGVVQVVRARVTHDPVLMAQAPLPRAHRSSSSVDDDTDLTHLKKANRKINAELSMLKIKKKVILTEEQLLEKEREKIRKALLKLGSSEDDTTDVAIPKKRKKSKKSKKKRKRTSSSEALVSSDSDCHSEVSRRRTKAKRRRESPGSLKEDLRNKLRESRLRERAQTDVSHDRGAVSLRRDVSRDGKESRTNKERSSSYAKASTSKEPWLALHMRSTSRECRSTSRYRSRSRSRRDSHPDSQYDSAEQPRPGQKAIEYRPNISDRYQPPDTRKPHTDSHHESIIVNKDRHINDDIDRIELETKKKEAIKDIVLDMEKPLNKLSIQNNAEDIDRKRVLLKFYEIVDRRFKSLKVTNSMSVSNLVMHYRCKYSKIEDADKLLEIFNSVISSRDETGTSSKQQYTDAVLNDLDSVLQEFDLALLEDVKPKKEVDDDDEEEEEGEITNIIINIIPTAETQPETTPPPLKELFTMHDEQYGYHVHITVDHKRTKTFFITIKKLLQQLKPEMKKYTAHIQIELFMYIARLILEQRISKLLKEKHEKFKYSELFEMYREVYPREGDANFIIETLCAIWRGEYNDSVYIDKIPDNYSNKKKTHKNTTDTQITIKQETSEVITKIKQENETDDQISVKQEKSTEHITVIKKEKETEPQICIKQEKATDKIRHTKQEKDVLETTETINIENKSEKDNFVQDTTVKVKTETEKGRDKKSNKAPEVKVEPNECDAEAAKLNRPKDSVDKGPEHKTKETIVISDEDEDCTIINNIDEKIDIDDDENIVVIDDGEAVDDNPKHNVNDDKNVQDSSKNVKNNDTIVIDDEKDDHKIVNEDIQNIKVTSKNVKNVEISDDQKVNDDKTVRSDNKNVRKDDNIDMDKNDKPVKVINVNLAVVDDVTSTSNNKKESDNNVRDNDNVIGNDKNIQHNENVEETVDNIFEFIQTMM